MPPFPLPSRPRAVGFVGRRRPLFWLALRTGIVTVLTLGIYRFWMKTRLRRWYWSAVQPGGTPLEYVGQPLEKLLGFCIAVVFLAFYIGLVNLGLAFASFALLGGNAAAYALSFAGIVPLIFYARYRARRYVLARTRWRGIRFGLDPGAWGYAARALGHWIAVIATAGILWPRLVFGLEKYRTDRTFWGDARLHQGGDWTMLMPAFAHLLLGTAFSLLAMALAVADDNPRLLVLLGGFVPWAVWGLFYWIAEGTRRLAEAKTARIPGRGDTLGLISRPRTGRIARIYLLGGALTLLILGVASALISGLIVALAVAFTGIASIDALVAGAGPPFWLTAVIALTSYFNFFLLFGVLRQVFITQPLWRHWAETLAITGAPAPVRQAARDGFAEAEGFAEALDVGGAI